MLLITFPSYYLLLFYSWLLLLPQCNICPINYVVNIPQFLSLHYFLWTMRMFSIIITNSAATSILPRWLDGKESTCQWRRCRRCSFDPWVRKMSWKRKWEHTPVFLPEKSHEQRKPDRLQSMESQSQTRPNDWAQQSTAPQTYLRVTFGVHICAYQMLDVCLGAELLDHSVPIFIIY